MAAGNPKKIIFKMCCEEFIDDSYLKTEERVIWTKKKISKNWKNFTIAKEDINKNKKR